MHSFHEISESQRSLRKSYQQHCLTDFITCNETIPPPSIRLLFMTFFFVSLLVGPINVVEVCQILNQARANHQGSLGFRSSTAMRESLRIGKNMDSVL